MNQPEAHQDPPATFSDAEGNEWQPRLDYVKLRKIRTELKLDLGNVEAMGRTWAQLLSDDLAALEVIWIAIDGDASPPDNEAAKDEWLAAMDGELLDAARSALKEAIYRFTPPLKRSILRQGLEAVDETYRRAIAEAERQVGAQIEKSIAKATAAMRGTPPRSAPASSASSTTAGRSGKRSRR